MKPSEKRALIQGILGVEQDKIFGPKTRAAFEALAVARDEPAELEFDDRTERNLATLLPLAEVKAREFMRKVRAAGINAVITSAFRSYEEQNELYAQGRTKPGQKVTNARGGESWHNFGVAWDVTVFVGKNPKWEGPEYRKMGLIGESLGLEWGGRWTKPDEPHFHLKTGITLEEARRKKANGDKIA